MLEVFEDSFKGTPTIDFVARPGQSSWTDVTSKHNNMDTQGAQLFVQQNMIQPALRNVTCLRQNQFLVEI